MENVWQLQEAKNQFSRVVNQALISGAQTITRHGEPVVVIIAAESYRRLKPRRKTVDVLKSCPVQGLNIEPVKDIPGGIEL